MFRPVINVVDALIRAPQSTLPPVPLPMLEGVPLLGLRGSVAQGLDLVQVALLHAEREPEVYQLEHLILSGPENVVRLEVSMDEAVSVEAEQRGQNIPSKLENQPRGEAVSVILIDNLSDIVLQQLEDKKCVALELEGVVERDYVCPGLGVLLQDEPLPLNGALVTLAPAETFYSNKAPVSDCHGFIDDTAPANTNLQERNQSTNQFTVYNCVP